MLYLCCPEYVAALLWADPADCVYDSSFQTNSDREQARGPNTSRQTKKKKKKKNEEEDEDGRLIKFCENGDERSRFSYSVQ
jgi:hypothetical protein